jgi:hypothetical protein
MKIKREYPVVIFSFSPKKTHKYLKNNFENVSLHLNIGFSLVAFFKLVFKNLFNMFTVYNFTFVWEQRIH